MGNIPRILVVEPYYGGSHRAFLEGLQRHVEADCTLLVLPARKWKMRMQLSAPWFATQVAALEVRDRWFDTILSSTFVDVAVLRVLLGRLAGWNPKARFCTYFHENQFAYPGRLADPAMLQFAAINFTTALASDAIAFNSRHNRDSFFSRSRAYVRKAADMEFCQEYERVMQESLVLYPGLDYTAIDGSKAPLRGDVPVIVWNHRWEHDKNPEEFFGALQRLRERCVDFRLIVLGQSFRDKPRCFTKAKQEFAENILHFGYASSRGDYVALLRQGDIVVSTANHEFFGLAVLEAVRAGCVPLLPNRLSYPELYPASYLYYPGMLAERLETLLVTGAYPLPPETARALTAPYGWTAVQEQYRRWLLG